MMKKRTFLKVTSIATAGSLILPITSCTTSPKAPETKTKSLLDEVGPNFTLPALGYAFNALEPAVDAQTMQIHHDKHHAGYVKNLNAGLEKESVYSGMDIETILNRVSANDTVIRNNGGGHFNHSLFWKILSPTPAQPSDKLANAINQTFGSLNELKNQLTSAALGVFGSGWAWLCTKDDGSLLITSTPNQDNPLMKNVVKATSYPLLGIDVWEHAYYLKYQNLRGNYVSAILEKIDWGYVSDRYQSYLG